MATNALMIDPHTGQAIDWTQAQGPSYTFGGIDPKMAALYQQAGLWNPEYAAAAGDWGSDPASRAQARLQWESSPEYQQLQQSLAGWKQGQARQDYNLADILQSPDGQQFQQVSQNQGPSFHSDDYRNMATVLLGGLGGAYAAGDIGAAAAAGSGGTAGAMANGALMGGATGTGVGGVGAAGYGGLAAGTGALYADAGNGVVSDAGGGGNMATNSGGYNSASFGQDANQIGSYGNGGGYNTPDLYSQPAQTSFNTPDLYSGSNAANAGNGAKNGTSLADFFSGNGSASDYMRAGQTLYGMYAQNKATNAAAAGNQAQMDLLTRMYDQNRADNQPLVDMRNSVLPKIQNLLANPSSITQDPGYQFQLKQGQNALNNRAAASGNFYSGQQMKAAQQYGQDYAGTKLDQSLNRLTNVAGLGQVGSSANQANSSNFGQAGGNTLAQGGNIRGSGYLGQYNTVNGAINGWQQDGIWNALINKSGS